MVRFVRKFNDRWLVAVIVAVNAIVVQGVSSGLAADSDEDKYRAEGGMYVGGHFLQSSPKGDFKGDSVLVGPDVIGVPKLADGQGFEVVVGGRSAKGFGAEFSYVRSTHDATSGAIREQATFNMVSLNLKWHLFPKSPLQPYFLMGFGFPWLTVENMSVGMRNGSVVVGGAKFSGIGSNWGGGLSYYITPHLALTGGVVYRVISYGTAEGVLEQSGSLGASWKHLSGDSLNFLIGTTYTF